MTFGKITESLKDPLAWLGGSSVGVITYLVRPGASFYALWIVVACDLISRIITESKNHGGFFKALKEGHVLSDKAMKGTSIKILAYFIMCVVAAQSRNLVPYQPASELFANVVYSILFFVEVLSIAENFLEAGVQEFSWLHRFTQKKLENICEESSTTTTTTTSSKSSQPGVPL